ncbi:glutamate ligase domain-containing protein [Rubrivirga sp. IMCC43871]|uniref:glutamate ligase domain-containing protein n=1 Tax=Rubrivirga sp. IMCC43871 TaxID=3391575 RepID=UPI00398F9333
MISDALDSRRQTGAGYLLDGPGAALEGLVPPDRRADAADAWRRHARALCDALGWTDAPLVVREFPRGLSLALGSPVDLLYTATDLNEAAWAATRAELAGASPEPRNAVIARLRASADDEADVALAALIAEAERRAVPLVWDDDAITVGLGARGQTFAPDALPDPAALDWDAVSAIPTALITGTNGKSTTTRILAGMGRAAGHTVGFSTTDAVTVGDHVVERGDFSGPLGARAVMRDERVTLAICESARGGLLRRGVPVPIVAAAALTNVAADHLGDYGVETVAALADAKLVVAKALAAGGTLVAPADEPPARAAVLRQREGLLARGVRIAWTALDPAADAPDGLAATVHDGQISLRSDDGWRAVCPVDAIPAALGGAAKHVVRNGLTAASLATALGLSDDAIAAGLRAFKSDASDNPGRANRFEVDGATVVVDYAHNAHGLAALADLADHWDATRRLVLFGSAGDRSDDDIAAMADGLARLRPDRVVLVDVPGYLRGRERGDVPALLLRLLGERGIPTDACTVLADPVAGTRFALDWLAPGDLAILLALAQRDQVLALVREAEASHA